MRTRFPTRVNANPKVLAGQGDQKSVAGLLEADAVLAPSLGNLERAVNYAGWMLRFIAPHLGDEVLEVGAGHGTVTGLLAQQAKRVVASELSGRCAERLRARFRGNPRVCVLHGDIEGAAALGPFDAVVMVNVLEHIEDDNRTLRDIADVLKPGGRVIIWVPALPLLYSEFDRSIGHFRRYRKSELRQQLAGAGYDVRAIRYVNAAGALAWLLVARFLGKSPNRKASLTIFDRYLVPVLSFAERGLHPPFGQSLFAVATRPPRSG